MDRLTYVNPAVPPELIRDTIRKPHISVLYADHQKAPFPYAYELMICRKMSEHGTERNSGRRGLITCGVCRGTYAWFLYYCVSCGKLFFKDFVHPKFCQFYAHCWDCLPELSWSYCPTDYTQRGTLDASLIREPAGFGPKTFSKDELDRVFDF